MKPNTSQGWITRCVTDVPMQREAHTSSLLIWLNGAPILLVGHIDDLRAAMKTVKDAHPLF
ncbi:hypothetical protein [Candidatus Nitrotoga arctica]|uniref:hypothetical protein n=1 Tax=Candidatus Nitrotoga arctica TaxID=453162 RepID=UPI001EFAFE0E|nr:hypothetical protein [Candidatus Nitrotoga arctica]